MRFLAFNPDELSELVIALDHRLAEAANGNAYVWTDTATQLIMEAHAVELYLAVHVVLCVRLKYGQTSREFLDAVNQLIRVHDAIAERIADDDA